VAAGEDQLETLVGHDALRRCFEGLDPRERHGRAPRGDLAGGLAALAAEPVDRPAARGQRDPRGRVRRDPVAGPAFERDEERVLDGLLGAIEVTERARQGGDRLSGLAPEQAVDGCPGGAQRFAPSATWSCS
jgi:hypothetical protein